MFGQITRSLLPVMRLIACDSAVHGVDRARIAHPRRTDDADGAGAAAVGVRRGDEAEGAGRARVLGADDDRQALAAMYSSSSWTSRVFSSIIRSSVRSVSSVTSGSSLPIPRAVATCPG